MTNTINITNSNRAEWAASALGHFQSLTGTDYQDSLGDLLCDLMHWSDSRKFDFDAALGRARVHYEAEIDEAAEQQNGNRWPLAAFPQMLSALELCEDVLSNLARLDDGTPSISALNAARKAIAKAQGGAE